MNRAERRRIDKDEKSQIRSKERVRKLGEVFTPPALVNSMLGLLPPMRESMDKNFLDPTCGTGNFLIEILKRKLDIIKEDPDYYNKSLKVLNTIYGIDISPMNVKETIKRLLGVVADKCAERMNRQTNENPNQKYFRQVIDTLVVNIAEADFLAIKDAPKFFPKRAWAYKEHGNADWEKIAMEI